MRVYFYLEHLNPWAKTDRCEKTKSPGFFYCNHNRLSKLLNNTLYCFCSLVLQPRKFIRGLKHACDVTKHSRIKNIATLIFTIKLFTTRLFPLNHIMKEILVLYQTFLVLLMHLGNIRRPHARESIICILLHFILGEVHILF